MSAGGGWYGVGWGLVRGITITLEDLLEGDQIKKCSIKGITMKSFIRTGIVAGNDNSRRLIGKIINNPPVIAYKGPGLLASPLQFSL